MDDVSYVRIFSDHAADEIAQIDSTNPNWENLIKEVKLCLECAEIEYKRVNREAGKNRDRRFDYRFCYMSETDKDNP